MRQRPVSVTIIGWLLIAVGALAIAFHFYQLTPRHAFQVANIWIYPLELVWIVSGAFILRGRNWARWLALAWLALHVAFSFFDSLSKAGVHVAIALLFAYLLLRPEASAYFRRP